MRIAAAVSESPNRNRIEAPLTREDVPWDWTYTMGWGRKYCQKARPGWRA
ncbi:hypothetical protein GCM10011494_00230 [Novosphingobium endophyticum]|uniref:Uncharacterized protein n=1 Tax=Novosphingobium endophyticum TaxID=1955250 RepID=A0A916TR68_9SPHN|nr:hypothetical protein GCM10011494_00230 [Novosphingobium endophyticum]